MNVNSSRPFPAYLDSFASWFIVTLCSMARRCSTPGNTEIGRIDALLAYKCPSKVSCGASILGALCQADSCTGFPSMAVPFIRPVGSGTSGSYDRQIGYPRDLPVGSLIYIFTIGLLLCRENGLEISCAGAIWNLPNSYTSYMYMGPLPDAYEPTNIHQNLLESSY
jgi:hypothetical protein